MAALRETVDHISGSAQRQASDVQQVNQAVGEMDKMTQQNAAMAEQCTAAARSLATQGQSLAQEVSRFRVSSSGQAAALSRAA